jgi:hypothetical protein
MLQCPDVIVNLPKACAKTNEVDVRQAISTE